MRPILLFDIGNQHINLGVFEGENLRASWRITTRVEGTRDEYAVLLKNLLRQTGAEFAFEGGAIASSVPPIISTFQSLCQHQFNFAPLVVGPGVKTGVRIRTDNPREVGADRIVAALAAFRKYGGPLIIIDFGTGTTYDAISAAGDYLGGAIAPGIGIAADALFEHAARLQRVELKAPPSVIGRNTVESVQAGILFGYVAQVEGMVARLRRELGAEAKVVATGGYARLIAAHTQAIQEVDDRLMLEGLRLIHELNR
jgi:type III pantothenate kinase